MPWGEMDFTAQSATGCGVVTFAGKSQSTRGSVRPAMRACSSFDAAPMSDWSRATVASSNFTQTPPRIIGIAGRVPSVVGGVPGVARAARAETGSRPLRNVIFL